MLAKFSRVFASTLLVAGLSAQTDIDATMTRTTGNSNLGAAPICMAAPAPTSAVSSTRSCSDGSAPTSS